MKMLTPLERKVLYSVTIIQYYSDYIRNVEEKFQYAFDRGDKAICPIHEDTDPSFGMMKDKQNKGVLLGHCFGCNTVVNVIRLHQIVEQKYKGRNISYEEAGQELANMYHLELSEADLVKPTAQDIFTQRMMAVRKVQKEYDFKDFQLEMQNLRLRDKNDKQRILSINRNLVRLINKELEETH